MVWHPLESIFQIYIQHEGKFAVVCSWCLSDKEDGNDEGGSWQFATQDTVGND